jgi:hypothetical protein
MLNAALKELPDVTGSETLNIIVLGMIAKVYAQGSQASPVRGWGSQIAIRPVYIDGKSYTVVAGRYEGRTGVRVTVRTVDTGVVESDLFVPYEVLDAVAVSIPFEDMNADL